MNRTKIEWVKNPDGTQGYTSNPVRGECPVGCSYCYVKPFRERYGWHKDIRFYPEELEAIRRRRKPAGIFLGSTIELFHDKTIQYMHPEFYFGIIDTIKMCPHHRFYLLTKQPQNLIKFSPFPPNVYLGVTATNPDQYLEARKYLKKIKATVKYISFEPLLAYIAVSAMGLNRATINWVIIGACTGTKKDLLEMQINYPELTLMPYGKGWTLQPRIEWVEEIVEACDRAGVPMCLKDNLKPLFSGGIYDARGKLTLLTMGKLRQELPK